MRRPVPALVSVVVLTAVSAGCDVHVRPIFPPPTGGSGATVPSDCPSQLIGYATLNDAPGTFADGGNDAAPVLIMDGGTSGGGAPDGGTAIAINAEETGALSTFERYAGDAVPGPLVIELTGILRVPPPSADGSSDDSQQIRVSSNKTIVGVGKGAGLFGGGLVLTKVSNVVIRNLVIGQPNVMGDVDAIHIETSDHIWIDHCDLSSGNMTGTGLTYDGLVDITDGSDFVTVSWTHYHDHKDTGIIGRSDSSSAAAQDAGKEHVTYDHDFFENVTAGPRIRFGTVHVLNGYFSHVALYGVASTENAHVRVEKSWFEYVTPPGQDAGADDGPITSDLSDSALPGYVDAVSNTATATAGANQIGAGQVETWTPPYPFSAAADSAASVPVIVEGCAGPQAAL